MARLRGFLTMFVFTIVVLILLILLLVSYYGVESNHLAGVKSLFYSSRTVNEHTRSNTSSNVIPRRHAIVCMIFTTPDKWSTRGRAVRLTWAKRCPIPIFFYSSSAASEQQEIRKANNTVALDVREGRGSLTDKTLAALRYSLDKYGDVAEWFMKADDDTYVVWENLEFLLDSFEKHNASPSYLGRKFHNLLPNGYTSGGGGYLIKRQAVELIVHEGPKKKKCPQSGGIEDLDIGRCLAEFGIYPGDTLDSLGRLRFHSDNPIRVLDNDNSLTPYYQIKLSDVVFGNPKAKDVMLSGMAVTFHYVTPGQMLMFDYLLYHLHRGARPPFEFSAFRHLLSTTSPVPSPVSTTSGPTTVTVKYLNRTETTRNLL